MEADVRLIEALLDGATLEDDELAYIKGGASASKGTPASLDDASGPTTATPNNAGQLILGFEMIEEPLAKGALRGGFFAAGGKGGGGGRPFLA